MDFHVLYDDEDCEEDDEFLFQSIQRYNVLQMFNLENTPQHLVQVDDSSICVASERKKGANSELLKLRLPNKLTLPPEDEGRSKENDFKVLSGVFTESLLHQIRTLYNSNNIITSENQVIGLQIYSFTDCSLGINKGEEQKLKFIPWIAPNFTVIQDTKQAICSKSCQEPIIQADVAVGKKLREIQHPFYSSNIPRDIPSTEITSAESNNLKCEALDSNLIAILNSCNGSVVLHDLRTSNAFTFLPRSSDKVINEIWDLSGCDFRDSSLSYFGIVSNRKSFCIYDKRRNSLLVENIGSCAPVESNRNMKLKFNNKADKLSISGTNSFVEIYAITCDSFKHDFTHNGHCPRNLPSVLVSDHIWLQTGGNEYVISICNNGTLHCWDHKT